MSLSSVSMDSLLAKLEAARTAAAGLPPTAAARAPKPTREIDFGSLLKNSLDGIDGSMQSANALAARFQMGDPAVSLEDSMVALQKASVNFQAAVQVRNKVVQAYQEIMNLAI